MRKVMPMLFLSVVGVGLTISKASSFVGTYLFYLVIVPDLLVHLIVEEFDYWKCHILHK